MWGWLLMALGLTALAVLTLTSGDIRDRLEGGGDRRTSRKAALAAAGEENRRLRERITELQAQINPIPSFQEIAAADAADTAPKYHQAAPAFLPGAQPRTPDPAPSDSEHLLTELVDQDPEATQALGVSALRAAAQMDAGRTATMAAISRVESVPPVTWGVPAGPGSSKPTELSETTGRLAVVRVANAMNEAS